MDHRTISIADQVFEILERDILTGVYARGEVLTETKLSEKLGVSRTPVREALRRMEQERLVVGTSRGMRVVGLDRRDIDDIYEIRSRVEGLAARRAAERAGEEELEQLKHLLDMQEFFTLKEDGTGIIDTDNHFHEMLYRMSGSLVLHDTLLPLHRKIVKYRQVSVGNSIRAKESFEEHRAIYEAVRARPRPGGGAAAAPHRKRTDEHHVSGGELTWDTPLHRKSFAATSSPER